MKSKENLPPPRIPSINVPTPKVTKGQVELKSHPMVLRRRGNLAHDYGTNYESIAAQHLYMEHYNYINHIYDKNGKEMSVDTLLKTNPIV